MIRGFSSISEFGLVHFAMKGLCGQILKAAPEHLDTLNEQYAELNQRRLAIKASVADAPFECGSEVVI